MREKLRYGAFACIAITLGLFLYYSEPDAHSKDVDINSLLNGDKSDPANVVRSSLASRKNIDLTAQPSDFTEDDALAIAKIFKDVTSGTLAQKKPSLDKEKNTDLLALKAKFGSSTTSDIKYGPGGKVRSIYDSISIAALDHNNQAAISGEIQRLAEEHTALFGLGTEGSIRDTKVFCTDDVCATKLKKEFHGLPAWDHETTVSSKGDKIFAIMGEFYEPRLPKPQPYSITNSDAIAAVAKHFSTSVSGVSLGQQGELGIGKYGDMDYYAFRFQNVTVDDDPYDIYIDAETGNVTKASTLVHEVAVSASGTALDGSEVTFQAQQNGSTYQMIDSRFPAGTGNSTYIFDYNYDSTLAESNSVTSGWPASGVSVLAHTKDTIDYFKINHNTNAPYPDGSDLRVLIDLNSEKADFQLTMPQMRIGIGQGYSAKTGLSLAVAKDVIGHEITHGLISKTSKLEYEHQSGALNESFSDFFGAMIDSEDWLIGEDLLSPSGKPLRNMANPRAALSQQPYHMDEYKRQPNTEAGDWGGVHKYSGIPNRALYLLAEGLQESIGRQKAANLAFKTMTSLTQYATFNDAAEYMTNLASQEYPDEPQVLEATTLAWSRVGLPQQDTTKSNISSTSASAEDISVVLYLNPYYSASSNTPSENSYDIYTMGFRNDDLEFIDSANIRIPTISLAKYSRPILVNTTDGGTIIVYQRTDGSYHIRTNDGTEILLDDGSSLADIAVSQDGNELALSKRNTNKIITVGADLADPVIHTIVIPSTSEGEVFPVTYIDKIRFDPTGRYVVFDFFLCQIGAADCTSLTEGYWSIGILDVGSGQVDFPFPSQPARFDVGFPTFSNLTDRYIAIDIVEYIEGEDNKSVVAIFDRQINSITSIVDPDSTTQQVGAYGYPSFSSDDTSIIYSASSDNQQAIYTALLEGYKLRDVANQLKQVNPYIAFKAYSSPLPKSTAKPSLSLSTSSLDFGQITKGTSKSIELCLKNQGTFPIDVYDSTMPTGFSWNGDNRTILRGKSVCSPVTLNTATIVTGSFSTTFSISHNGVGTNTPVSLSGKIDLDTDSDGISDSADTDDDGDGLTDTQEASYGTNPLLKDSDSDGFSDYDEIADGTDPLDANSVPMGGLSLTLIKAFLDKQKAEQ